MPPAEKIHACVGFNGAHARECALPAHYIGCGLYFRLRFREAWVPPKNKTVVQVGSSRAHTRIMSDQNQGRRTQFNVQGERQRIPHLPSRRSGSDPGLDGLYQSSLGAAIRLGLSPP